MANPPGFWQTAGRKAPPKKKAQPVKPYRGQGTANTSHAHVTREQSQALGAGQGPLTQRAAHAYREGRVVHYKGPLGRGSYIPKPGQKPVSGSAKFGAFLARSHGLPGGETTPAGLIPREQAARRRAQKVRFVQPVRKGQTPAEERALIARTNRGPSFAGLAGKYFGDINPVTAIPYHVAKGAYHTVEKMTLAEDQQFALESLRQDKKLSEAQKQQIFNQWMTAERKRAGITKPPSILGRLGAIPGRTLGQAALQALHAPAGTAYLAQHPSEAKQIPRQMLESLKDPEGQPAAFLGTASIPFLGGASLVARGAAAAGAEAGVASRMGAFLNANRNAMYTPRELTNPVTGDVQRALYSRTPLVRGAQRLHDKALGLDQPFVGPDPHDVLMGLPVKELRAHAKKLKVKGADKMSRAELEDALTNPDLGPGRYGELHQLKQAELGQRAASLGFTPGKGTKFVSNADLRMFIRANQEALPTSQPGRLGQFAQPYIKTRLNMEHAQNVRAKEEPLTPKQAGLALMNVEDELASLGTGFRDRRRAAKLESQRAELEAVLGDVNEGDLPGFMQEIRDNPPAGTKKSLWTSAVDLINKMGQTGQVLAKPAYLPLNMAGQVILAMTEMGLKAPQRIITASRIKKELDAVPGEKDLVLKGVDAATGEGSIRSMITDQRIVQGTEGVMRGAAARATAPLDVLHSGLTKTYSRLMDKPFRRTIFFHHALRMGYRTPEDFVRLFTDPAEHTNLVTISRLANRAMIDYGRLGATERNVIRRIYYFYPFTKGATHYAGHLIREHPYQAIATQQVGEYGRRKNQEFFGNELPSYLQGIIKTGSRKIPGVGEVPTVRNPQAISLLGPPAGVALTLTGGVSGLPGNASNALFAGTLGDQDLSNAAAPVIQALAASLLSIDIGRRQQITGQSGVKGFFTRPANLMWHSFPMVRAVTDVPARANRPDKRKFLFPYGQGDLTQNVMLGAFGERPLNLREARSRYRADAKSRASSPVERSQMSLGWWQEDLLREVNAIRQKNKLDPLPGMPKNWQPLVKQERDFLVAKDTERKRLGHKLTSGETAVALIKYLLQTGRGQVKATKVGGEWQYPDNVQKLFVTLVNPANEQRVKSETLPALRKIYFPNGRFVTAITNALKKQGVPISYGNQ